MIVQHRSLLCNSTLVDLLHRLLMLHILILRLERRLLAHRCLVSHLGLSSCRWGLRWLLNLRCLRSPCEC